MLILHMTIQCLEIFLCAVTFMFEPWDFSYTMTVIKDLSI